jgi:single-strand DNA-binding protein
MHATYTTLVGRMITAAEKQTYESGTTRVSFRVACTERRRSGQGWDDGETLYITVRCWRQLGENVAASMNVGDPVIAHGKVYTRSIEREGSRLSVTEMEAYAVGPDLRWATADVSRTKAAAAGAPSGLPEMPSDGLGGDDGARMVSDDPWARVEEAVAGDIGVEKAEDAAEASGSGDGSGRAEASKGARAEAAVGA